MNFDRDPTNTDEYFVTAVQIFDCCGVQKSGSLHVNALMDKFAPFVKTNKAEFSCLKDLLDPEQSNPDINVTKLANALHKYSESQKTKVDLDESFNLKSGQVPQDSDSGISTDGLQLLDELQCELKEKEHLAQQLRAQLDYSDRQHEEALAVVTAERDTLHSHLTMVREENATLCNVRRDYDEVCERLCASEIALAEATSELEALRKRAKICQDRAVQLENDKAGLQELLCKSKDECHRINEMYAARQAALLEDNEAMKTALAALTTRHQDHEEFMQQIIKEKVHLEMELKDVLNKSNQTHLRLDRSIDVSYSEDQMLTALDSLNMDSRFSCENRIFDEDSFLSTLKGDQGRPTNMSLFDEIRQSSIGLGNISRLSFADRYDLERSASNKSTVAVCTQTDGDTNGIRPCDECHKTDSTIDKFACDMLGKVDVDKAIIDIGTQTDNESPVAIETCSVEVQTGKNNVNKGIQTLGTLAKYRTMRPFPKAMLVKKAVETQTENVECSAPKSGGNAVETQTDTHVICNINNNSLDSECLQCESARKHQDKLEMDLQYSNRVITEVQVEIEKYEENLVHLQKLIDYGKNESRALQAVVQNLTTKLEILQAVSEKQVDAIEKVLEPEVCCVGQKEIDQASVSTQAEVPCTDCEQRCAVVPHGRFRKLFWEPLKCLFQVFAVICFICAVCVLCGVARASRDAHAYAPCRAAPWRWLQLQDIMDLFLRVEYTADVPM